MKTAIEKAGFTDKVVIGMDVAASEFFIEGKYDLDFKSPPNAARHISGQELADIYQGFVNNYPGEGWMWGCCWDGEGGGCGVGYWRVDGMVVIVWRC